MLVVASTCTENAFIFVFVVVVVNFPSFPPPLWKVWDVFMVNALICLLGEESNAFLLPYLALAGFLV